MDNFGCFSIFSTTSYFSIKKKMYIDVLIIIISLSNEYLEHVLMKKKENYLS